MKINFKIIKSFLFKNKKKFHCPFCGKFSYFVDFGNPPRRNVFCLNCESLERHRFLYYVYNFLFLGNNKNIDLLHMAPEKCLYNLFLKYKNINYIAADLFPENFKFVDCLKQDFCNMSFGDKSFDIIVLNQVMEHIKDEKMCLKEIRRCLRDDGIVIVNIPYKVGLKTTYEDKNISSDEDREKEYGQRDHVRLYGEDSADRFREGGFLVNWIREDVFNDSFIDYERLSCVNDNNINPGGFFILRKKM